jgi:hypothetical protein
MGDRNIRVWPVSGEGYGDMVEYPPFAKYRMEPHHPGAAGDRHHDLVLYTVDDDRNEQELGRHVLTEVLVAWAGQPSPFKSEGTVSVKPAKKTPAKADSASK